MNILSDRVIGLSESETLAMTRKSRELKAEGFDVINLSIGEPDFNTPEQIKKAGKKAIDENRTHYPPVPGYPELRLAISEKFKKENGIDYSPEQIVVSAGAKQSIANAILCLLNPEDEIIVPVPYWVSYRELIKLAEGVAVYIPTSVETNFKITPKQLEKAITPKTKLFLFSSPCNPSGTVYTKEELKALADVFAKHENIYIISDEIYEYINFVSKHESIAQFDEIKDRVIVINGVSKGYAMTGWRLGYLGATKEIAKACDKMQGQITSGTCSISQFAAIEALSDNPATLVEFKIMKTAFLERRNLVLSLLKDIPGMKTNVPQGAFYVFPDISYYFGKSDGEDVINDSNDLCMYLLNKAFVALVPGIAFGDPNCIRISYAASKDILIEAIDRIKKALANLK
ncbi:MAG: pyridoxal phosphate-dependent aminotransferase [Bacteroidales bacterium]|nr:pyridoxal phosphate-dependent aminotransferase [Bacteroidales bacterium]